MAYVRSFLLGCALAGFFLIGVPVQWVAIRLNLKFQDWMPQFFSRTMCLLLRVRVSSQGSPSSIRPRLIVANHISWADILVLGALEPVCFLAKAEVADWPGFGALAKLQRSIFVNRSRKMGLPAVNSAMAERMVEGAPVVLFAEATTSDGTHLMKFHAVHLAAARDLLTKYTEVEHVVVQPISIIYQAQHGLPMGRKAQPNIAWYGDMDMPSHLWALIKGGPIHCRVFYGSALIFDRRSNRKESTHQARKAIRQMIDEARIGYAEVQ